MTLINRPWQLGNLTIPNALVRSATVEGLSTADGAPTRRLTDLFVDLAKGGTGLIIAGTAYISRDSQCDGNAAALDNDGLIEPLKKMCAQVEAAGGVLAAQLLHCGPIVNHLLLPDREVLWGPSALTDPVNGRRITEMDRNRIASVIDDYAQAARRAKEGGFKAVQIHAAHGYLANSFLSRARNTRTDEYGGSMAKRATFVYHVHEAIRGLVGSDFPVLIKLGAHDGFKGGFSEEDSLLVAKGLDDLGIDAIEISGGTPEGAAKGGYDHILPAPFEPGLNLEHAARVKAAVKCPVFPVEGWRDPALINSALEKVDAVSMSRPFIREPGLAGRWLSGDTEPAECISCNKCLDLIEDHGLACIFNLKEKKK